MFIRKANPIPHCLFPIAYSPAFYSFNYPLKHLNERLLSFVSLSFATNGFFH